jgi:hypothetical protein
MSRALCLLLALQLRGWLRTLGRGLGTVRGSLLFLVGALVLAPWLFTVVNTTAGAGIDPGNLVKYGPLSLVLYCAANVVFSPAERAIYYTPAEVQMLFAGPFGRREVLAYKVLLSLLVSLPATLLMGAVVRVRSGWPPAVLAGLFLIAVFMQLFSMTLSLLAASVGEHLFRRGRRAAGTAAGMLAVAALAAGCARYGWHPRRLAEAAVGSDVWLWATWPLQAFFDAMRATQFWPDLARPAAVAGAVDAVLVACVFSLDGHYQEASAAASGRIYARLQRMRGRSAGAEAVAHRPVRLALPALPFWGGVGPIFWRQATTALRGMRRLLLVFFLLGVSLAVMFLGSAVEHEEALGPTLLGLGVWLSIFLTALVPFDFRGDLDRIAVLKMLPIAPAPLVVGQLLTPVVLLSVMQWLVLALVALLAPDALALVGALAAYVLPFNFALLGLENLLFLLFPVRQQAATPGDFQTLGRNVLLSMGKVVGLSAIAGAAFLVGLPVALLTESPWLGAAAAWPVVAAAGALLVPLVALAFRGFNAGADVPA